MKLFAPEKFWVSGYKGNGCGSGISAVFVPDSLLGVDISEACRIHDYMYQQGTDIDDKHKADRVFLNNMIRIVMARSHFKPFRLIRLGLARLYYWAVDAWGGPAYWHGKNYIYEMRDPAASSK